MKSRDDFKALIYEKCEKERMETKKKRRRCAALFTPLAACLTICCVVFSLPLPDTDYGTGIPDNFEMTVVAVDIVSQPESPQYERHYTDEKKTQSILSYLDALTLSDETPESDTEANGISYIITITYSDDSELVYVHSGNRYLRINNGAWKEMIYEEAVRLEEILNKTQTD